MSISVHTFSSGWNRVLLWDASVLIAARRFERTWSRRVMRALTRAGDTTGWLVHGLMLAIFLADGLSLAYLLLVSASLAVIVSQILKRLCRRARPDHALDAFVAGMANPDVFSFPSGHSTVAFAVATAIACADPALGALELALAFSIACSRIGLGAHYPLDVLAGTVLGVSSGIAASFAVGY